MAGKPTPLSVAGIYRIDGPKGKFYVGSAKWVSRRWIEHKRDLRKGDHANPKLQSAWDKYGEDSFSISVLEIVTDLTSLIEREQYWLDRLSPVEHGYNIKLKAESRLGIATSEETKRKQSEAHKGRKHGPMSEEQKQYYSQLYKGRKLSEETRRKMGESRRGKPRPEHVKAAIRDANLGRKLTAEHREKLSKAKLGRKIPEETKEKMRAAHARRRQAQIDTAA